MESPNSLYSTFTGCSECKNKPGPKGMLGYYFIDKYIKECSCHVKWVTKNSTLASAKSSNLIKYNWYLSYNPLKDYRGTKSLNEVKKLISFVHNYNREEVRETSLYLYGYNSTQKTTLAQWVGLSLVNKGYRVYYDTMDNIIKGIVPPTFADAERCIQKANKLNSYDLLIIDNAFNRHKFSLIEFNAFHLETFLIDRMDVKKKGIMFVSDMPIKSIKENKLSHYLQEFIERRTKGTVLTFEDIYEKFELSSIFSDSEEGVDK